MSYYVAEGEHAVYFERLSEGSANHHAKVLADGGARLSIVDASDKLALQNFQYVVREAEEAELRGALTITESHRVARHGAHVYDMIVIRRDE